MFSGTTIDQAIVTAGPREYTRIIKTAALQTTHQRLKPVGPSKRNAVCVRTESIDGCWRRVLRVSNRTALSPATSALVWISLKSSARRKRHWAPKAREPGQLANGIAHDLNNLLAGILPSVELCSSSRQRDCPAVDGLMAEKRAWPLNQSMFLSWSRRCCSCSESRS